MKTTQFGRQAVSATAIAAAILVSFAVGPVSAGHGYGMTEHPLRGDFQRARGAPAHAEGRSAPAVQAGVAAAAPERAARGDWLRGDFARASSVAPAGIAGLDGNLRVFTDADTQIPGFSALRREEVQLLPGAALQIGAETAIICEMAAGELEAVLDGMDIRRSAGDMWTCPVSQAGVLHVNTGTTPAMMRVFHLIPE